MASNDGGHRWFSTIIRFWLTTAIMTLTVQLLTPFGNELPLRMIYRDHFILLIISQVLNPVSGSLIDCTFIVEYLSSGNASKIIEVKRSLETTSPKSLNSSRD